MSTRVTAVIPTLARRTDVLRRSLDSVLQEADVVVVADGAQAAKAIDSMDVVRRVRVVETPGPVGFAASAQAGIDAAGDDYVLLLNDDAWLERGALQAMTEALDADPGCAGVGPKILFSRWPEIINSAGTVLHVNGEADSRGIGQPDLGQYDRPERVFGCHFAAALLRRELFSPMFVGPLDWTYGAYFEDVDWCLRANVLGYRFATAPGAVARHEHSASSAGFHAAFRLQERNLMWTAAKSFQAGRAARILSRRCAAHMTRRDELGPLRRTIVREVWAGMPRVLRARSRIQRRRRVPDNTFLELSRGERSWYDQREGRPLFSVAALQEAAERRGDRLPKTGDGIERALDRLPAQARTYWERLAT